MPVKVESSLKGKAIVLRVTLPRHRRLAVVIRPEGSREGENVGGAKLIFEIWGQLSGERLWHAWPGPHEIGRLEDDFLDSYEQAVVTGGLEELAEHCLGESLDAELMAAAAGAVDMILRAAAEPIAA